MVQALIGIIVCLLLLYGCTPQWAPCRPGYKFSTYYLPGKQPLRAHHSLLDIHYQFTLPAYTPVRPCQPPLIANHTLPEMIPGQRRIAYDTLDHDILILHPPQGDRPDAGKALGLAIDREGRLASSRPWYDLRRRQRIL